MARTQAPIQRPLLRQDPPADAVSGLQEGRLLARNVRTIQVLIDRESILTGAAASGEQPWKYYDLGEGYCSYDFFAKCPHRLACARCPFYVPRPQAAASS